MCIRDRYVNTFTHYTSFKISDDIPEGLTYKSAKVVDASGNDVTSKAVSYTHLTWKTKLEY